VSKQIETESDSIDGELWSTKVNQKVHTIYDINTIISDSNDESNIPPADSNTNQKRKATRKIKDKVWSFLVRRGIRCRAIAISWNQAALLLWSTKVNQKVHTILSAYL
jgi:hypothetical protein